MDNIDDDGCDGQQEKQQGDTNLEDLEFRFDDAAHDAQCNGEPWKTDPKYFKRARISAIALLKMVMHANSGGSLEVMGMLQGKIDGDTIYVVDTFALPVEGTETRVNAGAAEVDYMFGYVDRSAKLGRPDRVLGWYHSHPGYGCWLSGIDVNTQLTNQTHQDPWLAIVVDPVRTAASRRVEIGAFRCFPKGHILQEAGKSDYQSIPLDKLDDFGVHANSYYPLDISYFKSTLDSQLLESLWTKYWVNTLSSGTMGTDVEDKYEASQIEDIAKKIAKFVDPSRGFTRSLRYILPSNTTSETPYTKLCKDGTKVATEMQSSVLQEVLKSNIFS